MYTECPKIFSSHSCCWTQLKLLDIFETPCTSGDEEIKVAWMVSNCLTKSNREGFVEALQQYIKVDTFGSCYKGSLPGHWNLF